MTARTPFKRLILRAVLRNVSPMVIRVITVSDSLDLPEFDEVFRTVLGWGNLGFIFRVHGEEFNSFRRATRSKTISTAFVESTINQVVSRRFVKKQQMQWMLRGAHLLLQTRTKVLNDELDEVFRRWFPRFRPQPTAPERKAA